MKRVFFSCLLGLIFILGVSYTFSGCSRIKRRNYYLIARDPTWYPLSVMGRETKILAFLDELVFDIAEEEKVQIEFTTAPSDRLIVGLDSGDYDGVITTFPPSSISHDQYLISEPLLLLGPVLVVRADSTITSLNQLDQKAVGFQSGASLNFKLKDNLHIIFQPYENILFALENLERGQIDGVILGLLPANLYTHSFYKGILKIATPPLTEEGLRIMTLKNTKGEKLIDKFNQALNSLRNSSTYQGLILKWELPFQKEQPSSG